jgi:FkbH-like protein
MRLASLGTIKLVIWDLDDTFWDGTLTEGGIGYRRDNHDLVIALARRGVISAICSNNDEGAVRPRLEAEGIAPYFVFNRIAWQRKAGAIEQIIADAQLRAENVLFIDDRPSNLDEARAALPELLTLPATGLPAFRVEVLAQPETDRGLRRLEKYRVLDAKSLERAEALSRGGREEDFLRQCAITVEDVADLDANVERIAELIERTNQLNFTRLRLGADDLRALFQDARVKCGAIRVEDRYGDYGIVGFYALRTGGVPAPVLEHFLFSCRVLNMGIEAWLYDRLGRPEIRTTRDVTKLATSAVPDWIKSAGPRGSPRTESPGAEPHDALGALRLLAKGGCMLDQLVETWRKRTGAKAVTTELGQWASHTISLAMMSSSTREEWRGLALRWSANGAYLDSSLVSDEYDVFLLEVSKDVRCGIYDVGRGLLIPVAPVGFDLTRRDAKRRVAAWKAMEGAAPGPWEVDAIYGSEGLDWLAAHGRYLPDAERLALIEENLRATLAAIAKRSPRGRVFVLTTARMTAKKMFPCWRHVPKEAGRVLSIAERTIRDFPNATSLAIDQYMDGPQDFVTASPFAVSRASCGRIVEAIAAKLKG